MTGRVHYLFLCVILAALLVPASITAQTTQTLTVFAATSLTDVLKEVKTAFEAKHTGVEVIYNFGASSTLATQLKEGAPADVFASANERQMTVAVNAGRIHVEPVVFARNRLVVIVPIDNPARILDLRDLAEPGVKLVLVAQNAPVRDYTNAMLDRLAKQPDYGEAYKSAVLDNVVSEEDNVRQVTAKIALGEADAGIVYRSDVTPDITDQVSFIDIPDEVNTLAEYPIARTTDTSHPKLAQAFIDFVLSDEGQQLFVKWNFMPAVDPEAAQATPDATAAVAGGTVAAPGATPAVSK